MSDRYIFRGKRVDNGEWVEGVCVGQYNGKHYMFAAEMLDEATPDLIEVDPATVGMYLNRKDKHGKKIFSGMWVKHEIMRETYKYSNDGNPFENDIGVTMDDPLESRFHAFIYGRVAIRKSTGQVIVVNKVELCDDCDSCFYPDEPQEWNPDYYRLRCTEERTEVIDNHDMLEVK